MSTVPKKRITPQEYLARERLAETKSEYRDARIVPMQLVGRTHCLLVSNVMWGISNRLKLRPHEVYASQMRTKVVATGLYTYPDVIVVENPRFEDAEEDNLLNPLVLVEVPWKHSEGYDRGRKSAHYRQIESLQDYLIIDQNEYRVDRLSRHPDGHWSITDVSGLEASIEIPSLGIALPLAEIYERVDLTVPEEAPENA